MGSGFGEFLRTRRERVRPEDVGLPGGPRRRVPGLRREEVAVLAGISPQYYLRLEQGRDRHPSTQVLDALARALRLDADAAVHLHDLARPRRATGRVADPGHVAPSVRTLLDAWTGTPALVQGRYGLVLAANPLATALCPAFAPGVNALRAAFLEPAMRELYRDWEQMTVKVVAHVRSLAGADVDDPGPRELIDELCRDSERFRELWARQDVTVRSSGLTRFDHPAVGPLELHYEKFLVPAAPGQQLVAYHARPGTRSAERLHRLADLAAPAASGAEPSTTLARVSGQVSTLGAASGPEPATASDAGPAGGMVGATGISLALGPVAGYK